MQYRLFFSEMPFPANVSVSIEKTKLRNPEEITTKIYNKPRLTEYMHQKHKNTVT